MMQNETKGDEKRALIIKLQQAEGTTKEAAQWIARLKEIDPLFSTSDHLLGLERNVTARRLADWIVGEMGEPLSREQLVDLVRKLQHCEGTDVECEAWLLLLERNVPDPEIANLIFHSPEALTPEEVIDRAMAYRPIILGP